MKKSKIFLIMIILAVFSALINGYFYGTADTATRSVLIKIILDPALYKNDVMASQAPTFYTYVHYLFSPFYRLFGIEPVLFFAHLAGIFFAFVAVFYISNSLFKNEKAAFLSVLLLLVAKPSMGADTFRSFFVESELALPLLLFAFLFMVKKRYFVSFALNGIAANIHPTTAIPTFGMLFLYMMFNYKKVGVKKISYSAIIFLLSASPMLLWILLQKSSVRLIGSDFWFSLMKLVGKHNIVPTFWFASRIYIERWIRFFVFFALILVALKHKPNKNEHKAIMSLFYVFVLLLFTALIAALIPLPLIMNIELFRGTMWITFFGAMYLSNYLLKEYSKSDLLSRLILIGLGSSFFISNFKGVFIFLILLLADRFRKTKIVSIPAFIVGLSALALSATATFFPGIPIIFALKLGVLPFYTILSSIIAMLLLGIFDAKTSIKAKNLLIIFFILFMLLFTSFSAINLRKLLDDPYYGGAIYELSMMPATKPNPLSFNGFKQILNEPGKYITHNVQYPYIFPKNDWETLQLWVNKNTKRDDIIITPPYLSGFRLNSERAIVGEWVEVILSNVNEDFAVKIWERMTDLCNSEIFGHCDGEYGYTCSQFCKEQYSKLDEDYFRKMAKKYNAGYVVVEKPKILDFSQAYENGSYRIYKV